jgi:hypothetical protein
MGLSWVNPNVENVEKTKIKTKVKGSGQECPLHTGLADG